MDYKKYQKSRNMSWEILLKENVRELPVNIVELCYKLGITVKYYDKLEQDNDGKCTVITINLSYLYDKIAIDSGNALPLHTNSDIYCLVM